MRYGKIIAGAAAGWLLAWTPAAPAASRDDVREYVGLARRTLALVERAGVRRPGVAERLATIEDKLVGWELLGRHGQEELLSEVRTLRRETILAHPALAFDRLLINRRPRDLPGHMCDQYYGRHVRPGEGLGVLTNWKSSPRLRNLTLDKLPRGATMHPDLSFDGRRAVFAFCDAEASRDRRQLAFYLYEVEVDSGAIRQITGTASDPHEGWAGRHTTRIEDWDPAYLPDGGLAFVSTRSMQFGRCHGSRYVPSYCLYRCDADGSNIRRLSLNEANEWDPAVLHDGRIIYTRWDYINRHDTNYQSLWVTRPDGTQTGHFYGNYSVGPCMICEPQAIPGSHKVVATATDHHGYTAGSIIVIDPYAGDDGGEPLLAVTPEIAFPERGAPRGTRFAPDPPRAALPRRGQGRGRAATPWPISEDLFLVAYPDGGQYAIYLIDTLGGRELIYRDDNTSCFSPIPLRPRRKPAALPDTIRGKESLKTGRFFVRNVYDSTEQLQPGSVKRLRISRIHPQPTRAKPRLSAVANEILKEVLGTVPVEPDGSCAFVVPASTPIQFQALDANGMAVMTMRSLVYVMPGETAGCVGCHEPRHQSSLRAVPPARALTFRELEPSAGPQYDGGLSYMRTVQPVLDRYCIRCHGLGGKPAGGVDLSGKRAHGFSQSYATLIGRGGMVAQAHRNRETEASRPKDYFAHAGKLAKMLLAGHPDRAGRPRVRLDRDSLQRIVDWLDLNGQFYGDYSYNRVEDRRIDGAGERALREGVRRLLGEAWAARPIHHLVNVAQPDESRVLLAPLAASAGGWGQVEPAWADRHDPRWREMAKLVGAAIAERPHRDVAGTCGRPGRCECGCCWARAHLPGPPAAEAPSIFSRRKPSPARRPRSAAADVPGPRTAPEPKPAADPPSRQPKYAAAEQVGSAKLLLRIGKRDEAVERLNRVVSLYPGTKAARAAAAMLARIEAENELRGP